MSTGYDDGGVDDLNCVGPPWEFEPTAFTGVSPKVLTGVPAIALGVADFSFEFWWIWENGPQNASSDINYVIGFGDNSEAMYPVARIYCSNAAYTMRLDFNHDPTNGATLINGGNVAIGNGRWVHVACNFDRTGNMDLYADTTLLDSTAINANNLGSRRFYPYVNYLGLETSYDPLGAGYYVESRGMIGMVAMHNRLMTVAEINESFQERRVQNIPAVTQIMYDWRKIEGMTGWDYDKNHLLEGLAVIIDYPMGIPEGTGGTVTVPDQSGNGNDFMLPTRAGYSDDYGSLDSVADVRAWCAMVADPFWR